VWYQTHFSPTQRYKDTLAHKELRLVRSLLGRVWQRIRVEAPPGNPYPDWAQLLDDNRALWNAALSRASNGPPVLIATSAGGFVPGAIVESTLAVALTLRGAQVHVLLCDELLPACIQGMMYTTDADEYAQFGPQHSLCGVCFAPGYDTYRPLGLQIHRYSELVTDDELAEAASISAKIDYSEIGDYQLDGLAVGEHALAGTLRFFARGDLKGEPKAEEILRRYLKASLLTSFATRRLLRKFPFTSACFHHGIYVPQGLIGEVARKGGVRVVNWNPAYRKQCFIFSHHDTYHHTLLEEPVSNWQSIEWNAKMESEIMDYLKSRWQGTRDWIWFHEKPQEEPSSIAAELGLDFSRPCVGLLTNVIWDAQLHYRANAFPDMLQWVLQTIRYFSDRPEIQLLIRVHPAEIRGTLPSRQPIVAEINRAFFELPKNIFVIPPESRVSTYATMAQCNAVLIYGTKTGVELTSMGIPTVVAGEAWIRNKGMTMDARSSDEYFQILDQLPLEGRLNPEQIERARKYAYHFFFRRMIPLSFMYPSNDRTPYQLQLQSIKQLSAGREPGLDIICEGILNGIEFIYRAEMSQHKNLASLPA